MMMAMSGILVPTLYAIGVLACVFHLANGIWTMGITWGVWISPTAQQRASWACLVFGIGLGVLGLAALVGSTTVPLEEALQVEQRMYDAKLEEQVIQAERSAHKRWTSQELKRVEQRIAAEATAPP
jgi:succinate dehydrogenase / fumarate reductase cytochrome b subunit